MVNSPGHVGVGFAEIGTGLCETDVRRFQTSFWGPKPHRIWCNAPPGPVYRFKRTEEPCTKLSGVGVRLGSIKRDRLGAGALGLAHDRELSGVSARKRGY